MKAYENKNLIVPKNVVLTPSLDAVLCAIDKYWPPQSETVTSGLRTPEDQLRIIRKYLKAKGLQVFYPETMECEIDDTYIERDKKYYQWQKGWSALLNAGVIINPPFPAEVLMDYYRNGINKKGKIINQSPHTRGTAFDLSGTDSLTIVKRLVEDKMIRGYLVERENNCIHVDI
jgi:hypothetical protein